MHWIAVLLQIGKNTSKLVFAPQKELKKPKYKEIKIFRDGWERITLPNPPREDREVDAVIAAVEGATDQQIEDYKLCDQNASYFIEKHLTDNNLAYDKENVEFIKKQCVSKNMIFLKQSLISPRKKMSICL